MRTTAETLPEVLSSKAPSRTALSRRGGIIGAGAAAGLGLLIWIWRRPEQLTRPYVWDEESVILERFVDGGWLDALRPVNGYLILPANLLVPLAAEISFPHLPPVMYAFSTLVFIVTLLILLLPDSRYGDLPTRAVMALTMALVPVNPEVFGVLLYSFWWATLWPLIIVGWQRTLWPLRTPLLAVATLSSPAGGALSVVFLVSYLRGRRRRDLVSAAILVAGLILQLLLFLNSSREDTLRRLRIRDFLEQVLRTGGFFETGWLNATPADRLFRSFVGFLLFAFILASTTYLVRSAKRDGPFLLFVGVVVLTSLSAIPAPLISHPAYAGPRYFFLPFVALSWTLVSLFRQSQMQVLKVISGILVCVSLLNLHTMFSRFPVTKEAHLSWQHELEKCAASRSAAVRVPIYFDGSLIFWHLELTPAQCRRFTS